MSMKVISLDNLTRFANKLKDYFVQIKDSVRSVNQQLPDSDGNITLDRVDWAAELESSTTQNSDAEYIIRTSGGEASIEEGDAWLNGIYGKSVKTGFVQEVIDMTVNAMEREEGVEPITATIDRDTFVAYVPSSTTITLTYTTDWNESPTLYGITVTGTPIAGDQIIVAYTKGNRGTITNATPTAFSSSGWNQYNHTAGYARVINYSSSYGYRIDGTYTSLAFATTPTGTQTALSVTSNMITGFPQNWTEGYIIVTGGSDADTAIYPTWSDWTDGYAEHDVSFAVYSKSTINLNVVMNGNGDDVDGLFPHGLMQVGNNRDEINLNLAQAISRIERQTYNAENLAAAEASGRPYDTDEGYIYIVRASAVTTALTGAYAVDGSYTVSDHGFEWFDDTTVPVMAHTIYGASLKNKLERDTLTISQQTLTSSQQTQVRTNIGAASASDVSTLSGKLTSQTSTPTFPTGTSGSVDVEKAGNIVVINGYVSSTSATAGLNGLMMTLPEGYRPSSNKNILIYTTYGSNPGFYKGIISTNGQVLTNVGGSTIPANAYTYFQSVSFAI